MKQYTRWEEYPYNRYGNAVVLSEFLPNDWMAENLLASYRHYTKSAITEHGDLFLGNIVGYQSWHLPDNQYMISFHDPENKRRLIQLRPEIIVATEPFGPDKCPNCREELPRTFIERLRWLFGH